MVPKRKNIIVGNRTFPTKKAIRGFIRTVRDSYPDGKMLDETDFDFMLELLDRHENKELKTGCGIAFMYVKTNQVFKSSREFWIVRSDGSETDFSFERCLRPETKLQQFKHACRAAIANTVIDFKKRHFDIVGCPAFCPVSGEIISMRHNAHVDHSPPNTFDKIVLGFVTQNNIDVDAVELLSSEDGRTRRELSDKNLEKMFIEFHNQRAALRVVSKFANLSLVKRHPNKALQSDFLDKTQT